MQVNRHSRPGGDFGGLLQSQRLPPLPEQPSPAFCGNQDLTGQAPGGRRDGPREQRQVRVRGQDGAQLAGGTVSFYCGLDPTAASLHAGHLVPLFAMAHLNQAGHRAIALVGGGTARIGDPSGRSETRKMLSIEQIKANAESIRAQIAHFIDFESGSAVLIDNAEWLAGLNYIEFLRDIGKHFSVNRMLTFETYKMRLETGLSFIEFNYQLLQSYDFLVLHREHGCNLQIGGDDQWGNIVSGVDLIRRVTGDETFGLTCPLVTRSDGKKMGKTEKGALYLDANLVSPYEFFQYWRNIPDSDVRKFLLLFTFLPVHEVEELARLKDSEINRAKELLAFELTKTVHGEEEAEKARDSARVAFSEANKWAWVTLGYAATVVIGLLIVMFILANNHAVGRTFFDLSLIGSSFGEVLGAFMLNVIIFTVTEAIVLVWALFVAVARFAPGEAGKPIRLLAIAYIDGFRGLPAIITLYLVGFGLPLTGLAGVSNLPLLWLAIIALSLTYGAYNAEVYRAGIDSIHPSQISAARSLGLSYTQTLRFVVVPQAVRRMIPPLLNNFISLQKDTALVSVIGAIDAFNQAKIIASNDFNLSAVTTVAVLFVLITIPQARAVDRLIERDKRRRG